MENKIVLLLTTISAAECGEWLTSKGEHCIDRCSIASDNDPNFWCHITDPSKYYRNTMSRESIFEYSHEDYEPDYNLKWDYCVPSHLQQ